VIILSASSSGTPPYFITLAASMFERVLQGGDAETELVGDLQ
jgi:hypothetical protein